MKRSKRITQLKALIDRQAEQEAIKLAELTSRIQNETNKLEQLKSYKNDYLNQYAGVGSTINPQYLQGREKIMKQLDYAISQQNKQIAMVQRHVDYQKNVWMKLHSKVQAYQSWIEKLISEENLHESRQDQKRLDEFVVNQHSRKM